MQGLNARDSICYLCTVYRISAGPANISMYVHSIYKYNVYKIIHIMHIALTTIVYQCTAVQVIGV